MFSCDGRVVFHIIDGILLPQCGSEVLQIARDVAADEIVERVATGDFVLGPTGDVPAEGPLDISPSEITEIVDNGP